MKNPEKESAFFWCGPVKRKKFFKVLQILMARRAKADLFFLAKFILARAYFGEADKFDWHHEKICRQLQDLWESRETADGRTFLKMEWPRLTLKSTICFAFVIWLMLNDSNVRILIDCATVTKAEGWLRKVKTLFEDRFFQQIFGRLYNPKSAWNTECLTLTRTMNHREATVTCSAVDASNVSDHYDFIWSDDVQNDTNSKTREQIEKVIDHVRIYPNLLMLGGMGVLSMTRWAFGDVGEWIDDENAESERRGHPKPFHISHFSAVKENEKGEPILEEDKIEFPTLLPWKELLRQRRFQGAFMFSCNCLVKPQSDETAIFKSSGLQRHELSIDKLPEHNLYTLCDPAGPGGFKGANFTAMALVAITFRFDIYVMDYQQGHWTDDEIFERLYAWQDMYHPVTTAIETVFEGRRLAGWMKIKSAQEKRDLTLSTFKTQSKEKDSRILGLRVYWDNKKLFLPKKSICPDVVYLEDQFLKWKPGDVLEFDDGIDCVAYAPEFMSAPAEQQPGEFWEKVGWALPENWKKPEPPPDEQDVRMWQFNKRRKAPSSKGRFAHMMRV